MVQDGSKLIGQVTGRVELPNCQETAQLRAAGLGTGKREAHQQFGLGSVESEEPIIPPSGEDRRGRGWSAGEAQAGDRYLRQEAEMRLRK